jgi:hypothetical protein
VPSAMRAWRIRRSNRATRRGGAADVRTAVNAAKLP